MTITIIISAIRRASTIVQIHIGPIIMILSPTRSLGAYGVRYLFVIYGFSLAETENVEITFLLGRAREAEGSEPF
jgi:hypothetical protein